MNHCIDRKEVVTQMRRTSALRLGEVFARRRCPFVASRWNKRKETGYAKDSYRRVTMRDFVHLTQLREMNYGSNTSMAHGGHRSDDSVHVKGASSICDV